MNRPQPAPSATGVRIAGDRFQWLLAWLECVRALLDPNPGADNPVDAIGIEVDDVGNLDDVVVYRRQPPHSYKQVKYAVDARTPIGTDYLIAPGTSGGPCILAKVAGAWRRLAQDGDPIELAIVTNRAPDPGDPLITQRDARTRLLVPRAASGGLNSLAGKARRQWAEAAGLNEADLMRMLEVLDFDIARDRGHTEQLVKLTMLVAGLRGDDHALATATDWVAAQVVAGVRRLDLAAINDAVDDLQIRATPTRTLLSVATLLPDPMAPQARHALDWVDRFDGNDAFTKRRPKPPATWQELQRDIEALPTHLQGISHVAITGSLRQATAFAVGASLRMATNTDVAVVQRGRLWSSDAPYQAVIQPTVREVPIGQGEDLAVAVAVAAAAAVNDDVIAHVRDVQLPVNNVVVLSIDGGPRDNAVESAEHACALAIGIRDEVRRQVRRHARVHLFLAGPMGLALLLGHRWNRVAPTVVYEDLGQPGYETAFHISA